MENPNELPDEERQPCEVYTRVMGYHRPVSNFNPGKQQEHADRKPFTEDAPGVVEALSYPDCPESAKTY